jgi:hypothetical protein
VGGPPRREHAWKTPLLVLVVVVAAALFGGVPLAVHWAVGLVLLPIVLVAAHECAHALAGRLTGATVFEIRLGWRQARLQFRVRGMRVTIARGLARGGYCVAAFLKPRAERWRYAVLYGTPMVLHLAAAVAAAFWLDLPRRVQDVHAGHFFFGLNVIFFLASARPIDYVVGAYRIPNDGKALMRLLLDPAQAMGWWRPGFVLPAVYATSRGDALARARDVEHMFPDDPAVQRALFSVYWALGQYAYALRFAGPYVEAIRQPERFDERLLLALGGMQGVRLERWLYAVICLHGEAWDAALAEIERRLGHESDSAARAMWIALRAYVRLLRAAPGDAEDAAADAREAFEMLPWVAFVCAVYGAARIDAGAPREGLDLLARADLLDPARHEISARDAWRAIGHARLDRMYRARRCFREAAARGLEVGPPPALLRRAADAVGLAPARPASAGAATGGPEHVT